jgi:hypothetical protein
MPAPMDAILLPDRSSSLQAPTQPSSGALSPMQQAQEHGKGSREARRQHTSPYGCHLVFIQKQVPVSTSAHHQMLSETPSLMLACTKSRWRGSREGRR